jgi:8-oxo-dGTP pyrophosphatase MutT (NUDIX family)
MPKVFNIKDGDYCVCVKQKKKGAVKSMFLFNSRAIIERTIKDTVEIIVQTRNKPDGPQRIELPGGRIEQYESLITALIREVKEETGLDVDGLK